jgi:hypothetical protein
MQDYKNASKSAIDAIFTMDASAPCEEKAYQLLFLSLTTILEGKN